MIDWFKGIKNKEQWEFLKFDVVSFYPSITEGLLDKALLFGKKYVEIKNDEIKIIKNAAKSVLYSKCDEWIKKEVNKNNNPTFDITMGSYHGAEVCELVGLYSSIFAPLPVQLSNLTGRGHLQVGPPGDYTVRTSQHFP